MALRPALRPGCRVLRLDTHRVQVGSWPPVVLPDEPHVRAVLRAVDGVRDAERVVRLAAQQSGLDPTALGTALSALLRAGAVVDASGWPVSAPVDEVHAAAVRGDDPAALAGRREVVVQVHAPGSTDGLGRLITLAADLGGLTIGQRSRDPAIMVVASAGEPARDSIDAAAQWGARVVPVVLAEGRAVVGPWVHRGQTPCLRCADVSQERWGGRPALPPTDRGTDRPHGVGVTILQAAASLVVADALAAADGHRPATFGARWVLGPAPGAAVRHEVAFAPECPCHLLAPVS